MPQQLTALVRIESSYTHNLYLRCLQRRTSHWKLNDTIPTPALPSRDKDSTSDEDDDDDELLDDNAASARSYWSQLASNNKEEEEAEEDCDTEPWQTINLQIDEFERLAFSKAMNTSVTNFLLNGYPVRKGLIRKSQLFYLLQKYATKRPNSILHSTLPPTYLLEISDLEYLEESLNECYELRDMIVGEEIYIMKPSVVDKAQGIYIITNQEQQLLPILEENEDIKEWCIQQYIQDPYLYNNRKFHIRVYVLCVGNLQVYVYNQMLCLIATTEYSNSNFENKYIHITNTCVNQESNEFNEDEQVKLLSEVFDSTTDLQHIQSQINTTIQQTFECLHTEPTYYVPLHNAYELYGFDFLVDSEMNVKLLECNASPDLAQTLDRLEYVIEDLLECTFELAVDKFFEQQLASTHTSQQSTMQRKKNKSDELMTEVYHRASSTKASMTYY